MYKLFIRHRAEKALDNMDEDDYHRTKEAILDLRDHPRPRGCKKLIDNIYRIRTGDWRVIYMVDDKKMLIEIGKIARRSEETYKEIKRLFPFGLISS
ncbi:MAG: type II toxin-antitoxin system RelE/ParE family toxin [bacterium]